MSVNYVINYEIVDAAGVVQSYGSCWSGELAEVAVPEGQTLRILEDNKRTVVPVDEVVYGYGSVRAQEYPSLEEQIGVLWKVIANLPTKYITPEASEMLKKIADIKGQYEKGAEYVLNDGSDPAVRSRFMKKN